jgi:excisionase family DNA binding protein
MFKDFKDVVSVAEMMSMLKIGKNTAYDLLKNNKIQSIRVGRVHRIPKINIIKYLQMENVD